MDINTQTCTRAVTTMFLVKVKLTVIFSFELWKIWVLLILLENSQEKIILIFWLPISVNLMF